MGQNPVLCNQCGCQCLGIFIKQTIMPTQSPTTTFNWVPALFNSFACKIGLHITGPVLHVYFGSRPISVLSTEPTLHATPYTSKPFNFNILAKIRLTQSDLHRLQYRSSLRQSFLLLPWSPLRGYISIKTTFHFSGGNSYFIIFSPIITMSMGALGAVSRLSGEALAPPWPLPIPDRQVHRAGYRWTS